MELTNTLQLKSGDVVLAHGGAWRLKDSIDVSDQHPGDVSRPVLSFDAELVDRRHGVDADGLPAGGLAMHDDQIATFRVVGNADTEWEVLSRA